MITYVHWPVAELGVQVVVVVSSPGGDIPIVCRPHCLQRYGAGILSACRAQLVHLAVVLALQYGVRYGDGGRLPESVPVGEVAFPVFRQTAGESFPRFFRSVGIIQRSAYTPYSVKSLSAALPLHGDIVTVIAPAFLMIKNLVLSFSDRSGLIAESHQTYFRVASFGRVGRTGIGRYLQFGTEIRVIDSGESEPSHVFRCGDEGLQ